MSDVYVYVYVYVCTCICVYMYMCVHVYVCTCTSICTYTCTWFICTWQTKYKRECTCTMCIAHVQVTGKYVVDWPLRLSTPLPWQCFGSHFKYDGCVRNAVPQLLDKQVQILHSIVRDIIEKLDRSTYNLFPCDLYLYAYFALSCTKYTALSYALYTYILLYWPA